MPLLESLGCSVSLHAIQATSVGYKPFQGSDVSYSLCILGAWLVAFLNSNCEWVGEWRMIMR